MFEYRRNYYSVPVWTGFDFMIQNFPGIMEKYELKPQYKKEVLNSQIADLEKTVESLTRLLAENKESLDKSKKELAELEKKT